MSEATEAYTAPVVPAAALGVGDTDHIGPYRLLRKLGEGGMGTVYLAEQERPVRRQVAIKIIKSGLNSAQVIARFEIERQALALMDHPNIARVLEAGTITAGTGLHAADGDRPYFVMELVDGVPITRYCDEAKLSLRERVALFIPVCQAVQHAHQKGVVHRDLKPSNILIGQCDGRAVPKVIDFGVAKATGPRLGEHTMNTEAGTILGTLEYMAPEQAESSGLDVDTRADIYSLGVILYELLTGSPPFSRKTLPRDAWTEIFRLIRDVEPPRPSTKVSAAAELATVAAVRQTEPRQLGRLIHGDLDCVVMKCLEKDRARRYETANGLALDLQRYLHNEPVLAAPPSAGYRLRKFIHRNRTAVVAASLILLSLVAGIAGTTAGMMKARRSNAEAQRRLDQLEKGNTLLGSIFKKLDPRLEENGGPNLREQLKSRLDQAAVQLEGDAVGDVLIVAHMQDTLGRSLLNLGEQQSALALLQKAHDTRLRELGTDHADTLESLSNVATAYYEAGQPARALPMFEQCLEKRTATLGPDHPDVLASQNDLAMAYQETGQLARALPLLEDCLRRTEAKLGPDDPATWTCMNNLALGYQAADRMPQALALLRQCRDKRQARFGADHYDTLMCVNNLASALQKTGDFAQALPLFEHCLDVRRQKLGMDHPHTLSSLNNAGLAYLNAGQIAKAVSILEQCWSLRKAKLGPDHKDTLTTMNNLALAYKDAEDLPRALPMFEECLAKRTATLGPNHRNTLMSLGNLAAAYRDGGQPQRAVPLFEECLKRTTSVFGPDHSESISCLNSLATAYRLSGRLAEALPLYERCLEKRIATIGPDHPNTLTSINNLATAMRDAGRLDRAMSMFEECLEKRRARLGAAHPLTLTTQENLIIVCLEAKQLDRARPVVESWVAVTKQQLPNEPLARARALIQCGMTILTGFPPDAEALFRDALALRQKHLPADDWQIASAESLVGAALTPQKKFEEAEQLLLAAYEKLKAKEATIPRPARGNVANSIQRLAALYDAWGKPTEAAQRKQELAAWLAAEKR